MQIRPIQAADHDFTAWFDVHLAARLADYPNGPTWRERELRVSSEGTEHHAVKLWLAEDDDKAVGAAILDLPLRDNTKLGNADVYVVPAARRRGIGTALLGVIEEAARAEGRASVMGYVEGPTGVATPAVAFAERHGFTRRITEVARVQRPPFDLAAVDTAEQAARPHAVGYRVVTWRDDTPDEHVHELARLEGRMTVDAPMGELDYEGEDWDAARIRVQEARRQRMGRVAWTAAAVAPDGSLAGFTTIDLAADSDDMGFQQSTIVDLAHRGRRLGMLLKAANLRAVLRDRPGVQAIWTWNADSNRHMIGINEALGYQVEGWSAGYQRDL